MDPFVGLFDGPRARGAFALRCLLSPPWSLRILAESPLTLLALVKGEAWVVPDDGETVHLLPGSVALTRGPDHYSVADDPATPATVVIHPGQDCRSPEGVSLEEEMALGIRSWGNDPEGSTVMIVGSYESVGDVSDRLRRALPPVLSLSKEEWSSPLVDLLCDEVVKDEPGQAAVLDRLLDLIVIALLKAWFSRPEAAEPVWYRSQADPVVSRALQLLHEDPSSPWTVAHLATEVGVSRAALARRFHEVVGEPPMSFLTTWRLALAADLLCQPDETVGSVARKVGYGSPYALSTAFKRVRGISPQVHRRQAAEGATGRLTAGSRQTTL